MKDTAAGIWQKIVRGRPAGVVLIAAYFTATSAWSLTEFLVALVYGGTWMNEFPLYAAGGFAIEVITLICAVNLYRMKNWARHGMRFLMLVYFAGFAAIAVALYFLERDVAALGSGKSFGEYFLAGGALTLSLIIYAAVWHYLGRRKVVAQFVHPDGETAADSLAKQIAEKESESESEKPEK